MEKKHIITIAGSLGSGKSSTANKVAELLSYSRASTGDFSRAVAKSRGITLEELNKIAETDNGVIDKEIDDNSRAIREQSNIILDSRLGFFFIPESFKVFLELEPSVAAVRILNDVKNNPNRQNESTIKFESVEDVIKSITERRTNEQNRYKKLYGIEDNTAKEHFDLVINTANTPLESVASKIVEEYNKWLSS